MQWTLQHCTAMPRCHVAWCELSGGKYYATMPLCHLAWCEPQGDNRLQHCCKTYAETPMSFGLCTPMPSVHDHASGRG